MNAWRAHFFLNPESRPNNKETFGFRSKNSTPYVKELVNFENRMLEMVKNVKFRDVECNFLKKLSSDVKNVKRSNGLIVPADKTTNFYKLDTKSYNKLLEKNITKTYKKIPAQTVKSIQTTSKKIAERLHVADRVNTTAKPSLLSR